MASQLLLYVFGPYIVIVNYLAVASESREITKGENIFMLTRIKKYNYLKKQMPQYISFAIIKDDSNKKKQRKLSLTFIRFPNLT